MTTGSVTRRDSCLGFLAQADGAADTRMGLGHRLEMARKRRKRPDGSAWTTDDAAEFLGVAQSTYTRWENDQFRPQRPKIPAVARFLECSVEEVHRAMYAGLVRGDNVQQAIAELHARITELDEQQAQTNERIETLVDIISKLNVALGAPEFESDAPTSESGS
jgi:transcriptional regulator with XRE-family HTH domain